jgi:hypothetical protein
MNIYLKYNTNPIMYVPEKQKKNGTISFRCRKYLQHILICKKLSDYECLALSFIITKNIDKMYPHVYDPLYKKRSDKKYAIGILNQIKAGTCMKIKRSGLYLFVCAWIAALLLGCSQVDFTPTVPETPDTSWQKSAGYSEWPARSDHAVVSFTDVKDNKLKMWVIGGTNGTALNDVWCSADGLNWEKKPAQSTWSIRYGHSVLVYNNQLWILGGYNGTKVVNDVYNSSDGVKWMKVEPTSTTSIWPARRNHAAIVFKGEMWVLGGWGTAAKQDVWHSTDGKMWYQVNQAIPWAARMRFPVINKDDKSMWIFGGWNNSTYYSDVWYSEDGSIWQNKVTAAPWSKRYDHAAFYYQNEMWIMGGKDSTGSLNSIYHSDDDGMTWTPITDPIPWSKRSLTGLVFNNQMWIVGGNDGAYCNDAWCSTDGSSWKSICPEWSKRDLAESVTYNGRLWLIGGYDGAQKNDVWSSADGKKWDLAVQNAAWSARAGQRCVVFQRNGETEKLWLFGGYDSAAAKYTNDVYSSGDGATWTPLTQSTPFTGRAYFSCVIFNGYVYILGGQTGSTYLQTIYVSQDLANWSKVGPSTITVDNLWSARSRHSSVVYDNKIWVIGGANGSTVLNDAWSSSDATNWKKEFAGTTALKRYGHSSINYNNKIFIIGGFSTTSDGAPLNEMAFLDSNHNSWVTVTSLSWAPRGFHATPSTPFDNKIWVIGGKDSTGKYLRDSWYYSE